MNMALLIEELDKSVPDLVGWPLQLPWPAAANPLQERWQSASDKNRVLKCNKTTQYKRVGLVEVLDRCRRHNQGGARRKWRRRQWLAMRFGKPATKSSNMKTHNDPVTVKTHDHLLLQPNENSLLIRLLDYSTTVL